MSDKLEGPDFSAGVATSDIPEGKPLLGHVGSEAMLLVRDGGKTFAVSAHCTHAGAPLHQGLVVGQTLRCPWHHACFDLADGDALCAPALDPLKSYSVHEQGGLIRVGSARAVAKPAPPSVAPPSVTIIGAGAAGHAAAEMLRRRGYAGPINMFNADSSLPYDRTALSKGFLAGDMPESQLPLRPASFYDAQRINIRQGARVSLVNTRKKQLTLASNQVFPFDTLLLALGAEPVRLNMSGGNLPHVYTLRSLSQSQHLITQAQKCRSVAILGASFIGLEVASSLRARGLQVHVIAPETTPLSRVFGDDFGRFLQRLHEKNGVVFHLDIEATRIEQSHVLLQDGRQVNADMVVMGVGVRPSLDLAKNAGLTVDNGVVVDAYLQTSAEDIYAAGDICLWPEIHTQERCRVEHWAVAQRQGQTAARNMLGERVKFSAVPFFWSRQHKTGIRYVGHASKWDRRSIHGSFDSGNVAVAFWRNDRVDAVATMGCDVESLQCEAAMEQNDQATLQRVLQKIG